MARERGSTRWGQNLHCTRSKMELDCFKNFETAFAWLDKVATEHGRAANLLPVLDEAILARPFRSELIPQGPLG